MNTEILLRLAQTVEEDEAARVRESRLQLGMIEYLADSVMELSGLLTDECRDTDRVRTILEVASRLSKYPTPK